MKACYERVTNLIPSTVDNNNGAWWFVILQTCYKNGAVTPGCKLLFLAGNKIVASVGFHQTPKYAF